MATTEELTGIVRALNGVQSAGQARAAIQAALDAAEVAKKTVLRKLPDDRERAGGNELGQATLALDHYRTGIAGVSPQADLRESFASKGRKLVERVYIVIGGIEAEANHKPQISNLQILAQSIREAPGVFSRAVGVVAGEVGKGAGEVAREIGKGAGNLVGGVASGLGVSGTLTLAVVAAVILIVVTKGTILGRLFSGGGGGG